jgi:hypothetical protein
MDNVKNCDILKYHNHKPIDLVLLYYAIEIH